MQVIILGAREIDLDNKTSNSLKANKELIIIGSVWQAIQEAGRDPICR